MRVCEEAEARSALRKREKPIRAPEKSQIGAQGDRQAACVKTSRGACFPFQVKAAYLEQDARLLRSSHKALTKEIEERGISHSGERKNAVESIIWWRALIT